VQGNFIQREPQFGWASTERTEFRVLYDDRMLYIGIWAYDREPHLIRASEMKRDSQLSKGDQIKIEFESNFDGYVYFVNVAPSGKSAVIYPDRRAGETNNMIRERQRYVLPHSAPFEFDEEKGTEVLQVIMSRRAVPLFEDAIRNSRGELGTTASTAAAELMGVESKRSGIDTANTQRILPPEMRARSVRLAPAGNNDEKGTVIAVPDTKLKPGEVAVFEIRLRHV